MIIAVCSLAGSPGVTTLATALTAVWPATPLKTPVLVEADASGGDMAVWRKLRPGRGLISLAAASRRGLTDADTSPLLDHAVEVDGGLHLVTAPSAPHEAGHALAVLADRGEILGHPGATAVLDLGRIMPATAGVKLLARADAVLVVSRGDDVAQLQRVAKCAGILQKLREHGVRVGLAVTGRRFGDAEIHGVTGTPVWTRIPQDPAGAAWVRGETARASTLWGQAGAWVRYRRDPETSWSPLARTARVLAERIDDLGPRRLPITTGAAPIPPSTGETAPEGLGAAA